MAVAMFSFTLRNYSKVASANRLLVSNPQLSCLAAVSVRRDAKKENKMIIQANTLLSAGSIKPFSVSSKAMAQAGSDYSKLWTAERALAVTMVPLVPAAFYIASPAMDYLLAFTFTLHAHWGLEAIVIDYMRPRVVGPVLAKLSLALVYGLSAFTLGGLFYFNYSDVGIVNAIKMFWKL